jgi:hypothetical protein
VVAIVSYLRFVTTRSLETLWSARSATKSGGVQTC